jgi:hypothetical protein
MHNSEETQSSTCQALAPQICGKARHDSHQHKTAPVQRNINAAQVLFFYSYDGSLLL